MAVANSKESVPLPSRARTNTGMARCKRGHLRSFFFNKLRDTGLVHPEPVFAQQTSHIMGQMPGKT